MSGRTALIVDDDAFMRATIGAILRQLGITDQRGAADGEEALATLAQAHVDLLLCDLNMPGMDGIALLRHLAEVATPPSVVLLSGEAGRVLHTAEAVAAAHHLDVLGTVRKDSSRFADDLEVLIGRRPRGARARGRGARASEQRLTPQELAEGLERGLLAAAFQPQVDAATGRVVGVEALARWEDPHRGLLGPWAFIDVAEDHGLIGEVTTRMLEVSVEQLARWVGGGHDFTISVNVSVDDLADVAFADRVSAVLDRAGVAPERLVLEVTESKVMREVAAPLEVLTRLMMRHVRLALDDYGTGASSMEQLARIPFDELKIDRQFVAGALDQPGARAMLESAVDLARRLDLETLAEGVETERQWELVRQLGCDRIQGYVVAPALPAARFDQWLATWAPQQDARP